MSLVARSAGVVPMLLQDDPGFDFFLELRVGGLLTFVQNICVKGGRISAASPNFVSAKLKS